MENDEVKRARVTGVTVGLLIGVSFGFFNASLILWGISKHMQEQVALTTDQYGEILGGVVPMLVIGSLAFLILGIAYRAVSRSKDRPRELG